MLDNNPRSRPRPGFIGLGIMGGRMPRRRTAQHTIELADSTRGIEVAA
jgi:3-hydroxyisobutyrate dehydrogenase-like beta-hydroxyacid dehydrogenase